MNTITIVCSLKQVREIWKDVFEYPPVEWWSGNDISKSCPNKKIDN
jgi:hypothetical protein